MRREAQHDGCQLIAIHVAVVGQHSRRGDGQCRVFIHAVGVISSRRRIVDRQDCDGDRGWDRIERSVVGFIGENICAVVVSGG